MYALDDTVAAVGTPPGHGGIGIVRLSGPDAVSILQRVFQPAHGADLTARRITFGQVIDPDTGEVLDEVLAFYMPAPRTYTRQNTAEIQGHGGPVPLQRILNVVLRFGARLAEPGEFTLRAFVNGRLDLAQAEAVRDLIEAQTEASHRIAVDQLGGRLSGAVRRVRRQLLDVLAYLEASIDFTAEEVPPQDIVTPLGSAAKGIGRLLQDADQGIVYRQGARVAIVGRPNVGKSSLLNALLRVERAIVTEIPGTTRDTLEETINLRGVPLVLIDTAGIAESEDRIEQLGVARSREALRQADLALLVVDGSQPLRTADGEIADLVGNRPAVLVVNKSDLGSPVVDVGAMLPDAPHVVVSAVTGAGLPELEEALANAVLSGRVMPSDCLLVSNPRHKALLEQAAEHVQAALEAHERGLPADFVSIDVMSAVTALGAITGETASEDLLNTIFSQFCVGK
ncbi:MAG: tRNA modification GTPase MnmE [Anaerolineales bacterium]|nr:tRNA modification GTPase MnmE [Anaerolineales bacterium]